MPYPHPTTEATEKEYTIEIDCPPGHTRPSHLLPGVLKNTGVVIDPQETQSRFFGCFTWVIPPDCVPDYLNHRESIAERIQTLYHRGVIRYGSW